MTRAKKDQPQNSEKRLNLCSEPARLLRRTPLAVFALLRRAPRHLLRGAHRPLDLRPRSFDLRDRGALGSRELGRRRLPRAGEWSTPDLVSA
jgi:hypothetical protein